jgi:hypothetical protein
MIGNGSMQKVKASRPDELQSVSGPENHMLIKGQSLYATICRKWSIYAMYERINDQCWRKSEHPCDFEGNATQDMFHWLYNVRHEKIVFIAIHAYGNASARFKSFA